jgi:hypothetical protein
MRRQALVRPPACALAAALALAACDAGETKIIGSQAAYAMCTVAPVAPPAGVDAFYEKYYDVNGIPVMSSAAVSDTALASACTIVAHMLSLRADVRETMIGQQMRVAVIGDGEVTTHVPEYRNLYQMFPGVDWDSVRGVGATLLIPVASAGEENLACLANDRFAGENVLVQTFATSVLLGVEAADSTFDARLDAAYRAAVDADKWRDTYAQTNAIEYFAVGTQVWFDARLGVSPPDGNRNDINTRAELRSYDPTLAALIGEVMPDDAWRPKCP